MIARAGEAAKFTFLIHSHMLRHGCGYKLANDGQDTRAIQAYLGHRSIQSTVRYKLWHLIASRISGATEGAKALILSCLRPCRSEERTLLPALLYAVAAIFIRGPTTSD